MEIWHSRAQLSYDVELLVPMFGLASTTVQNIEILYSTFSKRFPVTLANIQVGTGTTINEYVIKLTLFNGLGTIEARLDSYHAHFNNLISDQDVEVAVECLSLLESAASSLLKSAVRTRTKAVLASWYSCEGGIDAVRANFSRHSPKDIGIEVGFEAASEIQFSINGSVGNPEELWSMIFIIEPSTIENVGHLFSRFEGRYLQGGKYNTLDERRTHFNQLHHALLKASGFELQINDSANGE